MVLLITVNYRGSIGFGQASIDALLGHVGTMDIHDVQVYVYYTCALAGSTISLNGHCRRQQSISFSQEPLIQKGWSLMVVLMVDLLQLTSLDSSRLVWYRYFIADASSHTSVFTGLLQSCMC